VHYSDDQRHPLGAIHGRFQPFHNGHMDYLERALERCEQVIVGITNPFPAGSHCGEATDPLRHLPENNPFTYFERVDMIVEACRVAEVLGRIRVVPFDVTGVRRGWTNVIPLDAVQLVIPHEPWDEEKARRFVAHGYRVEFLNTVQGRRLSATHVRTCLRSDAAWEPLVPAGTATVLRRLDRLRRLQQGADAR
jgi:cytidyltransferase-like protein